MIYDALLCDVLDAGSVRCRVCPRRCVIAPGKRGFCRVRENRNGTLIALTYGSVSSQRIAPIEAKPLYHYLPGSAWLSLGSLGCNCRCPGCQNWQIAHATPGTDGQPVQECSPDDVVQQAIAQGCTGISWTYNEPTMWLEFTIDASRLARQRGLRTNYVTNGYITPEALDAIAPHLDAWRVDIKAFRPESYKALANIPRFEDVLEAADRARNTHGLHVECVTNVVPGHNDDDDQLADLAGWIAHTLGPATPWHVTRFMPHLDLTHVPATPVATLERAHRLGRDRGLQYVYVGNVPDHRAQHTYCHACNALLIQRSGHDLVANRMLGDVCPFCGARIPGVWAAEQVG